MIDYKRVGNRIMTFRRLKIWTREDLADNAGIDHFTVAAIERGTCDKYEAIDAVCRALDVDTKYTLDPRNKEAEARAWGSLSDEDANRLKRVAEILAQKNGPGA